MPIFQGFERKRVLLKWESSEKKWGGRGLGVLGDWEKKGKKRVFFLGNERRRRRRGPWKVLSLKALVLVDLY